MSGSPEEGGAEEKPIRILICDDHTVVRHGLKSLIEIKPGLELAGEATDGVEAVEMARKLKPDVIIIDLVMPRKDGVEAITEIKNENPGARILVLTSFGEDDKVFPALKAGALGYLLKDSSAEELVQAIRSVHQGESSLYPPIARKLVRRLSELSDGSASTEEPLTERETDVLKLLAHGLSNNQISQRLGIGEGTVRVHVVNILSKLKVANRTQAALYALRQGLVRLDQTAKS